MVLKFDILRLTFDIWYYLAVKSNYFPEQKRDINDFKECVKLHANYCDVGIIKLIPTLAT